jgi:hypothetical protein
VGPIGYYSGLAGRLGIIEWPGWARIYQNKRHMSDVQLSATTH